MKPSVLKAQEGNIVAQAHTTLDLADERYPAWLRAIHDPPAVLYCDGSVEPGDRQAVAIVGARRATPYGLRVTETLARELSQLGFTIVSGLARGIDAAAHRAALTAGGRTIAVLGCGLDVVYPPEHASLQEPIAGCGGLPAPVLPDLSSEEHIVLGSMTRDPQHVDDLTERSRLTSAEVAGILLGLELKGLARQLLGQRYYRVQ